MLQSAVWLARAPGGPGYQQFLDSKHMANPCYNQYNYTYSNYSLQKRLATANIRGRSHKIVLTCSLITMQNLLFLILCARACSSSQNLGPPLRIEAWLTP